jgi:hypothetical protein
VLEVVVVVELGVVEVVLEHYGFQIYTLDFLVFY